VVLDGGVRHLSDKETAEYAEKLKDGKVLLTTRNGIFQARFTLAIAVTSTNHLRHET
jgi:hypothetical protein